MLDSVSWGELLVVGGVGMMLAGRKDLPTVSRFVGTQLGRVVGLLQGARHKADAFTAQNELKQLQNEFRSSLRELDQVKMELAMAASAQGVMGKTLGPTTKSANKQTVGVSGSPLPLQQLKPPSSTTTNTAAAAGVAPSSSSSNLHLSPPKPALPTTALQPSTTTASNNNLDMFDFKVMEGGNDKDHDSKTVHHTFTSSGVVTSSERAVVEEEWHKQGIGYKSIAESGQWEYSGDDTSKATGSELLEYLQRQTLIFDQYDQAMASKDQSIQDRIAARQQQQSSNDKKK